MLICKPLHALPDNFSEFLEEMVVEYAALYGQAVAHQYREVIKPSLGQSIQLPQVHAFGVLDGARVVGMIMGLVQMGTGQLVFIHVLDGHRACGIEKQLVQACMEALERETPTRIECETIPLYSVDLKLAFEGMGFRSIERALMTCTLEEYAGGGAVHQSWPVMPEDEAAAISCIVAAYQGHPDVLLHHEFAHLDGATALFRRFKSGAFGIVNPEWIRAIKNGDECLGVILGHAMPPDAGFIFQLAVQPDAQGNGLGTSLLNALMEEMARAGMKRVLLGVTVSNPVLGLYERLGFRVIRTVDVFIQEREGKN